MRLLLVIVVALVTLIERPADACSCKQPLSPCEDLAQSTVFIGRAVSSSRDARATVTTFEVTRVISGELGTTTDVRSILGCEKKLEIGVEYLVYAHVSGDQLWVASCSRTQELARAAHDLALAPATRKTARITGTVVMDNGGKKRPQAGVVLTVGTTKVTSQRAGTFRTELPLGAYPVNVVGSKLRIHRDRPVSLRVQSTAACPRLEVEVEPATVLADLVVVARGPDGKPVQSSVLVTYPRHAGKRTTIGTGPSGRVTLEIDQGTEVVIRACGTIGEQAACAVARRTVDQAMTVELTLTP
ncbi:MAG: hypothetical protein H0T42_29555 [Deltaproteobacteria bacterium]|nr:hypothetical protein [Deltaproteobacteria bacterium]